MEVVDRFFWTQFKSHASSYWNEKTLIPLVYADDMKGTDDSMKIFLSKIQYQQLSWNICDTLKVIVFCKGSNKDILSEFLAI